MKFNVVKDIEEIINDNEIYLIHTAWDDWFQYNTKYQWLLMNLNYTFIHLF